MAQAGAVTLHPAAGATDTIVSFARRLRHADFSDEVRYYARRHLLDTVGVMIAGAPGDVATQAEAMLAGVPLANLLGVPFGAAIGHWLGWRASFWGVALLATIAFMISTLVSKSG